MKYLMMICLAALCGQMFGQIAPRIVNSDPLPPAEVGVFYQLDIRWFEPDKTVVSNSVRPEFTSPLGIPVPPASDFVMFTVSTNPTTLRVEGTPTVAGRYNLRIVYKWDPDTNGTPVRTVTVNFEFNVFSAGSSARSSGSDEGEGCVAVGGSNLGLLGLILGILGIVTVVWFRTRKGVCDEQDTVRIQAPARTSSEDESVGISERADPGRN